jgi:outer membrane protein
VRRARVAFEVAQLETTKARAGRLPTVDAVASVGGRDDRGSTFRNTNLAGRTVEGTVGVNMNWTLYNGGAIQARVQETQLLEERSRNDLEAARRGIAQNTRVAFFNVLSGQAQVRALEAAESSSRLALEATQLGYRVGVRVNLDVLNAQTQLFNAQQALARARYDVLLGGLRLRQAAGQLAPSDIMAVNRLLAP